MMGKQPTRPDPKPSNPTPSQPQRPIPDSVPSRNTPSPDKGGGRPPVRK